MATRRSLERRISQKGQHRTGADPFGCPEVDSPGLTLTNSIAICEQGDRALPFQIHDDSAVVLAFLPGPVVDADDLGREWFRKREPANLLQKRGAAGAAVELLAQAGAWIAAQREAEVLVLPRQAQGASRRWCHQGGKSLGNDGGAYDDVAVYLRNRKLMC